MSHVEQHDRAKHNLAALCIAAAVVFVAKAGALSLPYYWDEISWANGAMWLAQQSVFRAVPGWYPPATFLGHPPALHVLLAILFKVFGQSTAVAHALVIAFSALGLFFVFKLGRLLYGGVAGIVAALFLLAMPVYFAQSAMFLGDVPVAALGVGCVYFALQDRYLAYVTTAVLAVLIKEPAAASITAIAVHKLISADGEWHARARTACAYAAPLLALAAFLVAQRMTTGAWLFINTANVSVLEAPLSDFAHRAGLISEWLFVGQSRFILVILCLLGAPLADRSRWRREFLLFALITVMGAYAFVPIYYLPRYVLPVFPFLCIAAAGGLSAVVHRLTRYPRTPVNAVGVPVDARLTAGITLVVAAGIVAIIHATPSHQAFSNYEWNMGYRDVIEVYQSMYASIERRLDQQPVEPCVLTVWPHGSALRRPELGYVRRPFPVAWFNPERLPPEPSCNLILWSEPADSPKTALRDYARNNGYVLAERLVDGEIEAELYQRADRIAH